MEFLSTVAGGFFAFAIIAILIFILASSFWIGTTLLAVGWLITSLLTSRPAGDSMALTLWGATSSWTLTALPLFLWMGEILFRSQLSKSLFEGLAPWVQAIPGRLLHTNIVGCTIFAAVSGSSAATCATVGKITLPELKKRGYPDEMAIGSLAGAGTLGLLIPPSIIMIVYGVAANVSIAKLFVAGVIPGIVLASLFSLYIIVWALRNPDKVPAAPEKLGFTQKLRASKHLIPVVGLIVVVLGTIYSGLATATEAAAIGVLVSLGLSFLDRTLTWQSFIDGISAACRTYCMIGVILAGAAFLTLAMGFLGLPRQIAETIGSWNLSPFGLVLVLMVFFVVLGCFLDGISMVVLTVAVLLPTVQNAGFDLLWFGIFIVLVVEMAQITPPVGFNLFVLQGMTQRDLLWLGKVAFPLFVIMILMALATYFFQDIVLWLPKKM